MSENRRTSRHTHTHTHTPWQSCVSPSAERTETRICRTLSPVPGKTWVCVCVCVCTGC